MCVSLRTKPDNDVEKAWVDTVVLSTPALAPSRSNCSLALAFSSGFSLRKKSCNLIQSLRSASRSAATARVECYTRAEKRLYFLPLLLVRLLGSFEVEPHVCHGSPTLWASRDRSIDIRRSHMCRAVRRMSPSKHLAARETRPVLLVCFECVTAHEITNEKGDHGAVA